jgi:hypothetical protein
MTNRVFVLAHPQAGNRFLVSLKGLQIRYQVFGHMTHKSESTTNMSLLGMESHLGVECQSEIRGKNTNKHEGNTEKEKTVTSSLN